LGKRKIFRTEARRPKVKMTLFIQAIKQQKWNSVQQDAVDEIQDFC